MKVLHQMYKDYLNEDKDRIIRELTRERDLEKSRAQNAICEAERAEARLSDFVMEREGSESVTFWNTADCVQFGMTFYISAQELTKIRANPELMRIIANHWALKAMKSVCQG